MSADLAPKPLDSPFMNNANENSVWYKIAFIGLCIVFAVNIIIWMNILRAKRIDEWRSENNDKGYQSNINTDVSDIDNMDDNIDDNIDDNTFDNK